MATISRCANPAWGDLAQLQLMGGAPIQELACSTQIRAACLGISELCREQLLPGEAGIASSLRQQSRDALAVCGSALAWNLKAWWALRLPEPAGREQEKHRAEKTWVLRPEFKTFVQAFIRILCQIVRTGRKLLFRLLSWNPYQPIFLRLLDALRL
jgi:hypothetical protein